MKTFRITFTSDPESGIYSANLVNAESAEQASAYFQTLGNYEIVGCTETYEEPKPGQPVHTVPEEWEAPEEEKATRTAEEITEEAPEEKKTMTQYEIKQNPEYNSTEIYFDCKPTDEERGALKAAGCRWHSVKKCWYTRKSAEEIAAILGSAPAGKRTAKPQPAEIPALTLDTLPALKKIENGGLYDGWEGANARAWKSREELKALLLADFRRAGIRATVRARRSGYNEKITVTVRIAPDEIKTFEEWRDEYRGNDIDFIDYLFGFGGWICYCAEDGQYKNIHSDTLHAMPEAERAELAGIIVRGVYRRFVDIEQDANTYFKKSASVLKKSAAERLKLTEAIVNTYNHDCSNSMIDYFDRWIYDDYCVKIA